MRYLACAQKKPKRANKVIALKDTREPAIRKVMRKRLTLIFGMLALLAMLFVFGCPFYRIFGIPCPCCGVTRAWIAFICGDVRLAFAYHGLFPVIPLVGILYINKGVLRIIRSQWTDVVLYIMTAAIFLYAIMRWLGYVVMP